MSYTDRLITVLRYAETQLRSVITDAVGEGAYREVADMLRAADGLSNLIREYVSEPESGIPGSEDMPSNPERSRQEEHSTESTESLPAMPQGSPGTAPVRRDKYPRFLREGDRLVKVAWSKKTRSPYEHRAPREVVTALLTIIQKKKGEGRLFVADDVFPLKNASYEEYPSYQSYLALNWLRDVGVIRKKGREGYLLKPNSSAAEVIERLWMALPTADPGA